MEAIRNLSGRTTEQVKGELRRGGRFVMYQYTISLIFITLQRSSDIYFIPSDESSMPTAFPFTMVSLLFGWWGIPWGPIRTIDSLRCNLIGGRDVTQEVVALMDSMNDGKSAARQVA